MERERGVVTWSAGNHAGAVAWAAAQEGVDCLVEMWEYASAFKVERARGFGAAERRRIARLESMGQPMTLVRS